MLHGEEGRAEVTGVQSRHVVELGGELCEILMFEGLLGGDPLDGVVSQQFDEYVLEVVGAGVGQKLRYPDAFFWGKVYFHVSGLRFKLLQHLHTGSSQDVVDPVHLVQLVLAREQRLFGNQLEEHAPEPPDVHLLAVVAVRHEALWRPVPPRRDIVCVGWSAVPIFARPQVSHFGDITLD